jgi:hypothetical protein
MDGHQVSTLVSMAGPQLGVYDPAFFEFFPERLGELTLEEIYRIAYTEPLQRSLSVANMWSDPYHVSSYLAGNSFLPKYNGLVEHDDMARFKENFLSLDKAVFAVGSQPSGATYDGGIGPWESGVFGYLDPQGALVGMEGQEVYEGDTFGLRTDGREGGTWRSWWSRGSLITSGSTTGRYT